MNLHIANTSKQHHHFLYRLPGQNKCFERNIPHGGQDVIKNLSEADIDFILMQHKPYGMLSDSEAKNKKTYTSLVYAIDRPVSLDRIETTIDANDQNMIDTSTQQRAAAVAATAANLANTGHGGDVAMGDVDASFTEHQRPGETGTLLAQTLSTRPQDGSKSKGKRR